MAASAGISPTITSIPLSPSKHSHVHKPNPHPYAIKTTSTGILSRSNSSGHNTHTTRYHYVPSSSPGRSASPTHHVPRGGGHRYSKSLSSESPSPLPVPPSFPSVSPTRSQFNPSASAEDLLTPPRRSKRADTLPSSESNPDPVTVKFEDLPSNPKLWTPSQLSSYLGTALRLTSREMSNDIALFVRETKMTGRVFLRLNESDLESMNINPSWCTALSRASRTLRHNVIRGRIWVDSSSRPSSPSSLDHPFSNDLYNSSTSSVDLTTPATVPRAAHWGGRVRGMVENFERGSGSNARSSSVSSQDGSDMELFRNREWPEEVRNESVVVVVDEPFEQGADGAESSTGYATAASGTESDATTHRMEGDEDEVTMESLLASQGARAWEDMDFEPCVTVKHIPSNESEQNPSLEVIQKYSSTSNGRIRGRGSGKERTGNDRRVVTAIFTQKPGASDQVETAGAEATNGVATDLATPVNQAEALSPDILDKAERQSDQVIERLESELHTAMTLLEVLVKRLEGVEMQLGEMETQGTERVEMLRLEVEQLRIERDQAVDRERLVAKELETRERQEEARRALSSSPTIRPQPLVSRVIGYFFPSITQLQQTKLKSSPTSVSTQVKSVDGLEPTSVTGLPSYVFLVSLGLCAVILKVVMRRLIASRGVTRGP